MSARTRLLAGRPAAAAPAILLAAVAAAAAGGLAGCGAATSPPANSFPSAQHWVQRNYGCEVPAGLVSAASTKMVRAKPDSHWTNLSPWAFWAVDALRPRRLVELGSYRGYSYFAFVQAIAELDSQTEAFAVDGWGGDIHYGSNFGEASDDGSNSVYARFMAHHDAHYAPLGFSHAWRMSFDEAADKTPNGSVDLLHIDGAHDYDSVAHDFATWLPKMSERGVMMFHDIDVHHEDFGVDRLWAELTPRYPHFAFRQWCGLGILGVGARLPAAARALFQVDEAQRACVHRVYEDLGGRAVDHQVEDSAGPALP